MGAIPYKIIYNNFFLWYNQIIKHIKEKIMDVKKPARQSNIELLRIVSMLLIIAHHFAVHSGFTFAADDFSLNSLFIKTLLIGGKLGVNIFVLISGYFLCTKTDHNIKKAVSLHSQILFYSILYFIFSLTYLNQPFTAKGLNYFLTPIIHETWWFATSYFVMFILSPYVNRLLATLSQKEHRNLLILLGIMWSGIFTLSGYRLQSNNVLWFFSLYALACYIRKYKDEPRSPAKLYLYAALTTVLSVFVFVFTQYLGKIHPYFTSLSQRIYPMESIFMATLSIFIFLAFKNTKMKSIAFINLISGATFGVYLLHDIPFIRPLLWGELLKTASYANRKMLIPYAVLCVAGIFIVGAIIELIRQSFFRLWFDRCYNLIKKIFKRR